MSTLYQNIEVALKTMHVSYLRVLERIHGIPLIIRHAKIDEHTSVYGVEAGEEYGDETEITGIVTGDDFFPTAAMSSGAFQEGFLYTTSTEVRVGDELEINSTDNRRRKYKIVSKEALGTTTDVFSRYQLSAKGD